MNDIFAMSEKLHTSPDLFPWVCLIVVLVFIFKNHNLITDYLRTTINAKREVTLYHAQHNELVRNNTAALDNNTAALKMFEKDREIMVNTIRHHEKLSQERIEHLQTVLDQTRDIVLENQKEIAIISDRQE